MSSYRLRAELPDPAGEELRLAQLHGDVSRVADGVEVGARVEPGELLEVAAVAVASIGLVAVVFVAEMVRG